MSLLLHIDTALETASICISRDESVLEVSINPSQKDHASWLHTAIKEICKKANVDLQELKAVAISKGPGSYTGLRVGMATAKGLCYALNIPLIAVSTLKMMAFAAAQFLTNRPEAEGPIHNPTNQPINKSNILLCPMIDARRMEVFTAVYTTDLDEVLPPQNLILQGDSFSDILNNQKVVFFGNGGVKFQPLLHHQNAVFFTVNVEAQHLVKLAFKDWLESNFHDLAYSEPFYGKEFYSPALPPPV